MTRVQGVQIMAARCCGAQYKFPQYLSMNFSAFEHWTDGWREFSLMPNDGGLRRCRCGQFVILKDMIGLDAADASDLASMDHVSDNDLPECIAKATSEEIEIAARREYWRHLNHAYRDRYRQHRDAEEATTKAVWEATNPDKRNRWDKLLNRRPPVYSRLPNSPFTYPSFEPTEEQTENMQRLNAILQNREQASRGGYRIEIAELYREQGCFPKAELVILTLDDSEIGMTSQLITRLIREKETAPMRYRM